MTDNNNTKQKRKFLMMTNSSSSTTSKNKSSAKGRRRRRRQQNHGDEEEDDDDYHHQQQHWKPVNVSLDNDNRNNDDGRDGGDYVSEEMEGALNINHYDNPKLIKTATKDLPVQPGEDVGIFFGLEVLTNYQTLDSLPTTNTTKDDDNVQNETTNTESSSSKSKKKKKKKSKKKQKDNGEMNSADQDDDIDGQKMKADTKNLSSKDQQQQDDDDDFDDSEKKPSKKKAKKNRTDRDDGNDVAVEDSIKEEQQQIEEVQRRQQEISQTWCQETSGAVLHPTLAKSLANRGFIHPTPIQAATLSASILGRRNLVGAAPTGSGKTIAFLLPILQSLLERKEEDQQIIEGESNDQAEEEEANESSFVEAIIVTPTRELATQIHSECDLLLKNQCVSLVGGIAIVKQKRLLTQKKPKIIIGTPGRLWAMISNGEHDHLKDLSQIRFLVLDEADRMTQDHCFPQLIQILDAINRANPTPNDDGGDDVDEFEDADENNDNEDRLLGLPGIRGEAPLMMLNDDILQQIEEQKQALDPETREVDDDEFPTPEQGDDSDDSSSEAGADPNVESMDEEEEDDDDEVRARVHRQTFVYSATLTLPFTRTSSKPSKKRRKKLGLDGAIADILEKAQAMGETKIVDLSSSSKTSSTALTNKAAGVRLPPGLTLEQIKCTQRHKDSHLFAYLMTTTQGASGPCLVFCNSIAAVRRVGSTLQTLGLSVKMLHAHMQQRARFKAVESLNGAKKRCVVVCTDVAARGLDIPSVSTIVHYDTARTVDLFVHRSGRTARGIGESAIGSSLSLVAPAEDKAQSKLIESLGVSFKKAVLDGRLLSAAQERVNLASKIIAAAEIEQKTNAHNRWFLEKAKETDLEIDDDLLETDDNRTEREQAQLKEARKAKIKLHQLLREPMKTQRFGKFLSTNAAAKQADIQPIKPPEMGTRKRKKRKRHE